MDLDSTLRELRQGLIMIDSGGRITEWAGGSEKILGWSRADAVGQQIDSLLSPKDRFGSPCCIAPAGANESLGIVTGSPEQEYAVETKAGSRWVGVTRAFERTSGGAIAKTTVLVRDITQRMRRDIANSEVISAVSHELRSPLTSVKGFTATLLNRWDRLDDETKKHLLTTINADADRLTRLIGELLDVSRIEAGRLELRTQPLQVPHVASVVAERHGSDSHILELNFESNFPTVVADADKVTQILTNLVENAIKYSPADTTIRLTAEEQGNEVHIKVADQGQGIEPEDLPFIFERFRQTTTGTGKTRNSVGLGLYIVRALVNAHGGRVWADSKVGQGTTFTIALPRRDATSEERVALNESEPERLLDQVGEPS